MVKCNLFDCVYRIGDVVGKHFSSSQVLRIYYMRKMKLIANIACAYLFLLFYYDVYRFPFLLDLVFYLRLMENTNLEYVYIFILQYCVYFCVPTYFHMKTFYKMNNIPAYIFMLARQYILLNYTCSFSKQTIICNSVNSTLITSSS